MGVQNLAVVLFTFINVILAASLPKVDYDVIVVGGGPSGLSTLSALGRVRRTALLFDDHQYRNGPTRHMHDVIGNDGTVPSTFRNLARKQISRYNTTGFRDVKVVNITKNNGDSNQGPFFTVVDLEGKCHTARKIVLGTGLRDVFPNTPGLMKAFGKGIYWCPWCDGWEHRDQPFGVLGRLRDVMGSVLEVWSLNKDIIAFVNGTEHNEEDRKKLAERYPNWEKQLKQYNVKIENRIIKSIDRLQDGSKVYDPVQWKESNLPDILGLERDKNDTEKIAVNINGMRTSVAGVFAVGDANNDGSTNVPHAMFSGKRAAVYVHVEIERENSLASIQKRAVKFSARKEEKDALRLVGRDLEDVWEQAQAISK